MRQIILSEYLVLLLCAIYFAALVPFTPDFASEENLTNILSAMLPLLVVATGQTLVLIAAGIDLSVTSVIALASVTGAMVMTGDGGWLAGSPLAAAAGVAVMPLIGAAVGLLNGALITGFRMPPFIVTLTGMMFFSGFAIWLTKSESIYNLPPGSLILGQHVWASAAVAVMVAGGAHLGLTRTLFGRRLYAVGHNPRAALVSGVPVARVTILAYVLSGLCAGLAAVLITGRLETASPVLWRSQLLDVVGAVVIGGTSLYGGRGRIVGTVYGVLFLTLIDNSLNLLNLSHFSIMMVKGGVILLAAVLDSMRNKLGGR